MKKMKNIIFIVGILKLIKKYVDLICRKGENIDNKIWNDFMEYLRFLILSKRNIKNISDIYKPIVISYFFDSEVYGDGIQSYFEIWCSLFDNKRYNKC